MKRSELYRMMMESVLESEYGNSYKLEMLKVLFEDERIALFTEERNDKEEV